MNIVKLRDILMPSRCSFAEFFNSQLKGKYAYWIQMRYIFPLDSMDYMTYIQYEQYDDEDFTSPDVLPHIDLYSEECCMYSFSQKYIDCDETNLVNTLKLNEFKIANEYTTEADVDISKLRNFRSWLAGEILKLNTKIDGGYLSKLNDNQIHMLEYYKNDMYNDVVKQLSIFGLENAFTLTSTVTGCNCCNTNISGLYNINGIAGCNALDVYTKNLHTLMVQTFEDTSFWMELNKDFLVLFKKYIDNIIKVGFVINNSNK